MAKVILFFFLCLFSTNSYAVEYKIANQYHADDFDNASITGLGNNGRIYGNYPLRSKWNYDKKPFYFDLSSGFNIYNLGNNVELKSFSPNGHMLGYNQTKYNFVFVDELSGIQKIKFTDSDETFEVKVMNDNGQILGTGGFCRENIHRHFYKKCYIWDHGNTTEITSEIDKCFTISFPGASSVQLDSFNNKGTYVGNFYNLFNPKDTHKIFVYKDKQIFVTPTIQHPGTIPNPLMINNKDEVLISVCKDSYIWNYFDDKLEKIYDFLALKINDSSTIIGYIVSFEKNWLSVEKPAIWKEGKVIPLLELLDTEDVKTITEDSDEERIKIVDINNHGDILIRADLNYYVLEPISDSEEE